MLYSQASGAQPGFLTAAHIWTFSTHSQQAISQQQLLGMAPTAQFLLGSQTYFGHSPHNPHSQPRKMAGSLSTTQRQKWLAAKVLT